MDIVDTHGHLGPSPTGGERMVMGSDHPPNLAVELAKWRATGIGEQDLANVFGVTPRRVFALPAP